MPLDAGTTQQKDYGQINLAPVEPLQKIRDDRANENSSLAQIIQELHDDVTNRHVEERRQMAETARLMGNCRSGKQIMMRDPLMGALALVQPLAGKPKQGLHVYPLAQVNSSQLTSIWTLSAPKILPRHFGTNNKAQIQHALIETIIGHYDPELFDEWLSQRESLSMMDWGTNILRPTYDKTLNTLKQMIPVIANQDKTVFEGYGFCKACHHDGPPDMFKTAIDSVSRCPQCGSHNVSDLVPQQILSVPTIVGQQEMVQGDIGLDLLPVGACNWDMRGLVQDSEYFQYVSEIPTRMVESILGIEVAGEDPDNHHGLSVINALGTRGGSVEGQGQDNLYGNTGFDGGVSLMWEEHYKPSKYMGLKLDREEKTLSGEIIPAGVPLEQIFKDGICAIGFNDMRVIAGIYNEKNRAKSGVYHIQSHSGVGKGTSDSIDIAEQLNIGHSASLHQLKRIGAGGGIGYDRDVLTMGEVKKLLKPGGLAGVSLRGTGYTSVNDALWQVTHQPLVAENLAFVAQLSNMMNIVFQTTEMTAGVANQNIDVNTLGGQQMLQAQNQQRSVAPLRMKGYTKARVFEEVIDLFRKYIQIPRFFGTNDRFALTKGRMISGVDMPERVKCDFVADSEIPQNTLTKRQNAEQMLEKSANLSPGGFSELAIMNPRMAVWWTGLFGVDMPMFNQTEILMRCQDRLDQIKEICADVEKRAELSGYYPPLNEAAIEIVNTLSPPLALSEENHVVKAQVLSEYLDDDEVKEWSPVMRASVEALIQQHYTLDRDARFRVPALDQEGQIKLQVAGMQAQAAAAAPMQAQEEEKNLANEGLSRMADQVEKEADFDRDQEKADLDHERNLQIEQVRQKGRPPRGKK